MLEVKYNNPPYNRDFHSYYNMALRQYDKHEFGVPTYRGVFYHKLPNNIYVASYNGNRIMEWHPNGDIVFIFSENHTPSVSTRMSVLFTIYSVLKKKNARGDIHYLVSIGTDGNSHQVKVHNRLTVRVFDRTIQLIPDEIPETTKDNAKYRAFNKQLKELKVALAAQCMFGAYKHIDYRGQARTRLADPYISHEAAKKKLYELSLEWIETKNPKLLEHVATFSFCISSGIAWNSPSNPEVQKKAVLNAMRQVQLMYLRSECVI
jgi:hypothetical protein